MSHVIIDKIIVISARSKSHKQVGILLMQGGDNNLFDENNKRVSRWHIESVSYGELAFLEGMMPFFHNLNNGNFKIPSLGSYNDGSSAINLGARGYNRVCNYWKKAQVVDLVLPDPQEWTEKDHARLASQINGIVIDGKDDYVNSWNSNRAMGYMYPSLKENTKKFIGLKHLIKNFKDADDSQLLTESFAKELAWQKESGDVKSLYDIFDAFSRWKLHETACGNIDIDALKFHMEAILTYYNDYIHKFLKAHPEEAIECAKKYPELLLLLDTNIKEGRDEDNAKYANIKNNYFDICDAYAQEKKKKEAEQNVYFINNASALLFVAIGDFAKNSLYSNTDKLFKQLFVSNQKIFNKIAENKSELKSRDVEGVQEHIKTIKESLVKQQSAAYSSTKKRNPYQPNVEQIRKLLSFLEEFPATSALLKDAA